MEIINCNTAEEAYDLIANTLNKYEGYVIIRLAIKDYYKNKDRQKLEQSIAILDNETKQIIKDKIQVGNSVESTYNTISTAILKQAVKNYFDNVENTQMLEREIVDLDESTKHLVKNKIQSSNSAAEAYNKIKHIFITHQSDHADAFINMPKVCRAFGYNYDNNSKLISLISSSGQKFNFSLGSKSQSSTNFLNARIFENEEIKKSIESFKNLKKYNNSLVKLSADQEQTVDAVFNLVSLLDGKDIKKEVRKIYINDLYKISVQEGVSTVSPYQIKYLNRLKEKLNTDISFESEEYEEIKTALNDLTEKFLRNDKKSLKKLVKSIDDKETLKQLNIILSKRKDLNHIKINEQTVQKMVEITNLITQMLNSNVKLKTKLQASIRSFKVIPVFLPKEYKDKVDKINISLEHIKEKVDYNAKEARKIHTIKYIP